VMIIRVERLNLDLDHKERRGEGTPTSICRACMLNHYFVFF